MVVAGRFGQMLTTLMLTKVDDIVAGKKDGLPNIESEMDQFSALIPNNAERRGRCGQAQ